MEADSKKVPLKAKGTAGSWPSSFSWEPETPCAWVTAKELKVKLPKNECIITGRTIVIIVTLMIMIRALVK